MGKSDGGFIGLAVLVVIIALILGGVVWGYPQYKIYKQEMQGEANFKQAQYEKQIMILEANARMEAGKLDNERQLNDANATARANEIVAGSLDPMYINYLVANKLVDANTDVVYIPTEAGLPIMEAARFAPTQGSPQAS